MLTCYVLREPRFMTPTAVTSPRTRPPSDDREMTETQKPPSKSKIYDFPCIYPKKVVSLHANCVQKERN